MTLWMLYAVNVDENFKEMFLSNNILLLEKFSRSIDPWNYLLQSFIMMLQPCNLCYLNDLYFR